MSKSPISPISRAFRRAGGGSAPSSSGASPSAPWDQRPRRASVGVVGTPTGDMDGQSAQHEVLSKSGREVGVTRPKRRLSRAQSNASSPPVSPIAAKLNGAFPPSSYQPFHAQQTTTPSSSSLAPSSTASASASASNYASAGNNAAASSSSGNYASSSHDAFRRTLAPVRLDALDEKVPAYVPAAAARQDSSSPKLWGIELKWFSLITLALQNAFLTIIMHYSRISTPPERTYSAAAAVLLNELLKGAISVTIALSKINNNMTANGYRDGRGGGGVVYSRLTMFQPNRLAALKRAVFSPDWYKLGVPAILYVIQNNLQYVAASNLDVATFQVTYQMKILTTAFFSVLMLGKRLSRHKWAALFMLAMGVGIVQLQTSTGGHATSTANASATPSGSVEASAMAERVMHPLRGFMAVTFACLTSGLAGVYFELLLKSGPGAGATAPDLWVRNTQLSLFSLLPAAIPILFSGHAPGLSWTESVASKFANFNAWALGTVLTQTFGGLITAIVIRYSDNIMKGFATSLSILISSMASVALFNYQVTFSFVFGALVVLAATFLYNSSSVSDAPPTRKTVAVAPGSPIPTTAPILGETGPTSRTSSILNLLNVSGSRPNSRPASRRPSTSDLKQQPYMPLSMTQSYSNQGSDFSRSRTSSPQPPAVPAVANTPTAKITSPTSGKPRPNLTLDTKLKN